MATTTRSGELLRRAVGVLTAGAVAVLIGMASAGATEEPEPSGDGRDTTGWHHIDPRGHHHSDQFHWRESEHDDARRAHYEDLRQDDSVAGGRHTWMRVERDGAAGWQVCSPMASYC